MKGDDFRKSLVWWLVLGVFAGIVAVIYVSKLSSVTALVEKANTTYDFIIVGAGTAGSVLANRLTEDGRFSVLLLEAGGEDTRHPNILVPLLSSLDKTEPYNWMYTTVPQKHANLAMKERGYMYHSDIMEQKNAVVEILQSLNLSTLVPKFEVNKLTDITICEQLDNATLRSLGLETIGDCVRFRDALKRYKENDLTSTTTFTHQVRELFRPKSSTKVRNIAQRRKQNTGRPWTASFLCVADKNTNTIPNGNEKILLQKCGLGLKRITLLTTDDENQVQQKLTESFSKLAGVGGFELLKVMANKRSLEVIKCSWSVENLKAVTSQQSKIYIRPIQKNLSILANFDKEESLSETKIQEKCIHCGQLMNISQLRDHLITCSGSDDDVLYEPFELKSSCDSQHQECQGSILPEVEDSGPSHFQQNQGSILPEVEDSGPSNFQQHDGVSSLLEVEDSDPSHFQQQQAFSLPVLEDSDNMELTGIKNSSTKDKEEDISEKVEQAIQVCSQWDNPVEILKYLQTCLVAGRKLEVENISESAEGETNHICVDRHNILETAFDEIRHIENLRTTLEVDFYGEGVSDLGGPRKEFFRLVLMSIKEKYFDHGLRNLMAEDYVTIGKIFALSILQNGNVPTFIPNDVLNELFFDEKSSNLCIKNLRMGLDKLGIYQVGNRVPAFVFLLRPASKKLTVRALTHLLKPKFSDTGSNSRILEGAIYSVFMRYIREVASGRRGGVTLSHILEFVTGASEEPVLGFSLAPSIEFVEVSHGFIPTANTCSCCMYLPRGTPIVTLPSEVQLFTLYDYAFQNRYFGIL